jgi:hypothetical protein
MAARYTKSIPNKIYFYRAGGDWFAGPFVKPPRGYESQMITCKVEQIENEVKKKTKK